MTQPAEVFHVELRAPADSSDPGATRRLKRLLKFGLRVCGLKCVAARRVTVAGESQLEGGQPLVDLPLVPSSEVQADA